MADVGNEAAPAADGGPGDQRQRQSQNQQPQQQRAPPAAAARVNRGTDGGTRDPLINMRDRLFYTLFHRFTLTYARACPKSVRRLLETMILIKVRLQRRCGLWHLLVVVYRQEVPSAGRLGLGLSKIGMFSAKIPSALAKYYGR